MIIFNYKKWISFLPLFFVLLSNPIFAKQSIVVSEILRKSKECFNNSQSNNCSNLILEMEKIQLIESEQNRFKCQASILGLQTELIEAYYFKKINKNRKGIMIPYVIKNC